MKRFILIICQIFLISTLQMMGQGTIYTVDNVVDLKTKAEAANQGDIIKLSDSFDTNLTATINLVINHSNSFTVDGNGKTLAINGNFKHFNITKSSNTGTIIIKEITIKGRKTDISQYESGKEGGGININSSGEVILDNINIINNQNTPIYTNGTGYVFINNSTIEYNMGGQFGGHGGAALFDSNINIKHSTFNNNVNLSYGWSGGAIAFFRFQANKTATIENCLFINNQAIQNGGAIGSHSSLGAININNCYFEKNRTTATDNRYGPWADGGAIGVYGSNQSKIKLKITNSTFYQNESSDDGGAIYIENQDAYGGTNYIANCTFFQNKANNLFDYDEDMSTGKRRGESGGGAIHLALNSIVTLENNSIIGNSSPLKGGGLGVHTHANDGPNPKYILMNNIILGNESTNSNDNSNVSTDTGSTETPIGFINIGIDNGTALASNITLENVFGTNTPTLSENSNNIKVGNPNETDPTYYKIIPTMAILPNDGEYVEGLADDKATVNIPALDKDQRSFERNTNTQDLGSVEIQWVRFDANGGEFDQLSGTLFNGKEYYNEDTNDNLVKYYYAITHHNGNVTNLAADPVKTGEVFEGWVLDDGNETPWNPARASITENTKVIAKWNSTTYTVFYKHNAIDAINIPNDESNIASGTSFTISNTTPTRNGYTFSGWKSDFNGLTYPVGGNFIMPSQDVNLTAQWNKNPTPPVIPPVINPNPEPKPEKPDPEKPQPKPETGIKLEGLQVVCSDETIVTIPFELVYEDRLIQYLVKFSNEAKAMGCVDEAIYKPLPTNNAISFVIPSNMPNGKYKGTIVLKTDTSNVLIPNYPFEFEIISSVKIVKHPVSVNNICEGDGFKLTVEAVGDELAYQWYFNDKIIIGANQPTYEAPLTKENEGVYFAEVIGICGVEKSQKATVSSNNFKVLIKWDDVLYILNLNNRYVSYQWYKDGSPIQEYGKAVYYTHTNGLLGTYKVRAYKADGTYEESCSMTFSEKTKTTSAAVYPNPVARNENISVVISEIGESKATIHVYDITGRQVYNTQTTMIKTDIPVNLPTGTYVVKITLDSGKTINQKLIVK